MISNDVMIFKGFTVEGVERFEKFKIVGENFGILLGNQITTEYLESLKNRGYTLYLNVERSKK